MSARVYVVTCGNYKCKSKTPFEWSEADPKPCPECGSRYGIYKRSTVCLDVD